MWIFEENTKTELYVANLPPRVDDHRLRNLFEQYGSVVGMLLESDDNTSSAFLTMPDMASATAAVQGLNGSLFDGLTIEVSLQGPPTPEMHFNGGAFIGVITRKLHVTNLPSTVTKKQLKGLFSKYMPVDIEISFV